MPDYRKIAEGVGINVEQFDRVKLGRGVVGKSAYIAAAAILVLAAVALRADGSFVLYAAIGACLIIFLVYFVGVLWFATKNPGAALLEGAELIQWRQMEMGLKGVDALPAAPNVEPPTQIEGPTGK